MIQEFSFGNFRSFKDIQTLNFSAAKIKSKSEKIDIDNTFKYGEHTFLKSKAIYGANASGKSNIIKAFVAFVRIIQASVKYEKILTIVDSFRLSTETENAPSFFQMIFWHNNVKYRYGFELNDENILAEWLYAKPGQRELTYFIRDNQEIIEIDKTNFTEGYKLLSIFDDDSGENEIFRNNSLFLSSLASLGFGKLSKELINELASIIVINGLGHLGMYAYAGDSLSDVERKKYIIDFLKYGDLGIENLDSLELPSSNLSEEIKEGTQKGFDREDTKKLLISFRKKFNKKLEAEDSETFSFLSHESEGTQKLFELSPFIYEALKENRPILIDEFDARFHPLLTKKIVELFNSSQNSGSQLLFMTHDTNLLSADLLRRDQIEFVEKDKFGASHLYSLVQFKGVRNNASFERDYIQGKYGAIPFLGDFSKLLTTEFDA